MTVLSQAVPGIASLRPMDRMLEIRFPTRRPRETKDRAQRVKEETESFVAEKGLARRGSLPSDSIVFEIQASCSSNDGKRREASSPGIANSRASANYYVCHESKSCLMLTRLMMGSQVKVKILGLYNGGINSYRKLQLGE